LHAIAEWCLSVFHRVGERFKPLHADSISVIESFPVPVCDNSRIPRARLYDTDDYRGYLARQRRYC